MLDLIEFIGAIIDAWYLRRIIAAIGAIFLFYYGITSLPDLPNSKNFLGDLVVGFGSLALAVVFAIAAVRPGKKKE